MEAGLVGVVKRAAAGVLNFSSKKNPLDFSVELWDSAQLLRGNRNRVGGACDLENILHESGGE